jgi:poly(3-hydroxybutyrate) depolymerase/uncharacterized protein (DUF2141 family)
MKTKLSLIGRLVILLWCGLAPVFLYSQQIPKSLTAANGTYIGFWEYKPTFYNADPNRKFPLIIFLHGIGEQGSNLNNVLANAIPKYIAAGHTMTFTYNGQSETFLVLSPQLQGGSWTWPTFYVAEMIKYAKQNLRVDTNRIYLTGLSLGGGGTWKYAAESYNNARQLAAIAPVCGTCSDWSFSDMATSIAPANLPVWAFHASNDGVVGYGCTTGAIGMLNSFNPGVAPIMSIYPNGDHYIWDRSYDTTHNWHNPNMYEWFLSHSRGGTAPAPNIPPVARAGSDQTITLPANSVTVNGSASSDADGSITGYNWSKISGPAQFAIANPNSVSTGISNLAPGTYSFQLTVTDNRGAIGRDTVNVTVNGSMPTPNTPPVALAGADQSITLPNNNVFLFGSASYDPDGFISSYAWSQVSGPSTAAITVISTSNVNVSNLQQGVYRFRLVVTDNLGATASDTLSVTVSAPNVPPVASAGADQSIQLPVNSVTLNGAASVDPDGTIMSYAWSKIAGPAQYNITNTGNVSTTVTNLAVGTYSFRLLVTDNRGATDDDTVVINVAAAPPPPNVAPTANAGSDQSIQLPVSSATLNGSASSDADGSITSYAWSKIAGPAQYNIVNSGSVNTTVDNLVAGTYSFRLIVTDNNGATDDDTVVINVAPAPPPPNVAPTANAGNDQSIQLPTNSVTLDGSASTDPDGSVTTYAWSKIAGPSQYNIANAGSANTTVTNLVAGSYSFRLVVTDNNGATDDDTVVINVAAAPNMLPTANAGGDQSIQLPANSVTLSGAASSDADGTITGYAWTKISGPAQYNITSAGNVSTTVTNLAAGTYAFRLVVTDNDGGTDADTVVVNVGAAPPPPNVAPTANAGSDQFIQLPTNSAALSGSASSDADGTITSYSWSKVSGPAQYSISDASNVNINVTNLVAGTYSFRLVVTDNNGATDADTVVVNVAPAPPPPNMPPVANAGNDQSIQLPTSSVTLSGAASTDADGTITTYAWSKISGPAQFSIANANGVSTSVSNLVAGTYAFRLVVTDNDGATDDDTVVINVAPAPPPPNVPPVADAGNDQTIQLPANIALLNGTASADADGTIASYAWTKISGPAQYNITNAGNVTTSVTDLVQGVYRFRLVVTDNNGATDDDTVMITVSAAPPPPNVAPIAKAGNDATVAQSSTPVSLDGSASYDPDGSIVAYAWSRISGPTGITIVNATTVKADVVGMSPGEYVFELTVTDNNGATATDQVKITVTQRLNQPPVAKAGRDTLIAIPATSAWLSAQGSRDPDGSVVAYQWKQVAGPAAARIQYVGAPVSMVSNLVVGDYQFELTVTDDKGATGTDTVIVSVVNNFRYEESLLIYPNPVAAKARIRCVSDSTGELVLRVVDLKGRFVKSFRTFKGQSWFEQDIMLTDLRPGIYYVEAIIGDKKRMIKKFIKQ